MFFKKDFFFKRKLIDIGIVSIIATILALIIALPTWEWLFYGYIQDTFRYNVITSVSFLSVIVIVSGLINYLYYFIRTLEIRTQQFMTIILVFELFYFLAITFLYMGDANIFYEKISQLVLTGYFLALYNLFLFITTLIFVPFSPTIREEVLLVETLEDVEELEDNWRMPPQTKAEEIGYNIRQWMNTLYRRKEK